MTSNGQSEGLPESLEGLEEQLDRVVTAARIDDEGRIEASLDFSQTVPFLEGHFPGNPIWPGAFLIKIAMLALNKAIASSPTPARYELREIVEVKFLKPITPNNHLTLTATLAPSTNDNEPQAYRGQITGNAPHLKFRLQII